MWFEVSTDDRYIKAERAKARELRRSQWWLDKLNRGVCEYCDQKFSREELTMDHVVPLARGGSSSKGNIKCACKSCNASKKLATPAELLLTQPE